MNTTENNKIIAKFMGYAQPHPEYPNTSYWYKEGRAPLALLLYNSSWDWLMEVVEKIESLGYSVDIFNKAVSIQCNTKTEMIVDLSGRTDNSKLSQVYEAVVEFIKYKN